MATEVIEISLETLNKVLSYLGKRPFEEVFDHINKIQSEATNFIKAKEAAAKSDVAKVESVVVGEADKLLGVSVPAPDFPPAAPAEEQHVPV